MSSQGDLNDLGGHEFEDLIERLLIKMGFATEGRKEAADGGIDIIAVSIQPLVSGRYIIQCKRYSNSVSSPIVRDLYGVVMAERANKGILITTSAFTSDAIEFAQGKPIELVDGPQLIELLGRYSLLEAEIQGSSPAQMANATLRNEFIGLTDGLGNRLKEAEADLVLNSTTFGDESRARTYKAYSDWLQEINGRFFEAPKAIVAISNRFNEFEKGGADLVGARRIRHQAEEVFRHLLSMYVQLRKARPPQVFAKSHAIYENMVHSFIVDYLDILRKLEEALEKVGTGMQDLNFKLKVVHADEFVQANEEAGRMLEKMRRNHQVK